MFCRKYTNVRSQPEDILQGYAVQRRLNQPVVSFAIFIHHSDCSHRRSCSDRPWKALVTDSHITDCHVTAGEPEPLAVESGALVTDMHTCAVEERVAEGDEDCIVRRWSWASQLGALAMPDSRAASQASPMSLQ